jgi:LCP family protein required for cell wall assembly
VGMSAQQRSLLAIGSDEFHAGFLVAGRDVFYSSAQSSPIYDEEGQIVCWSFSGQRSASGVNTDAIVFVQLRGAELVMILLPRDLFVGTTGKKLGGVYHREGADALRRRIADILGVPVDYHAIIDLGIFERLVDALGGVPVNVPSDMVRNDCAARLGIDLRAGPQLLDGRSASYFVRFRDLPRGDLDRLDNMKLLAYGLLERLQQIGLRDVGRLPRLLDTLLDEVETNLPARLLTRLLPSVGEFRLEQTATLPVVEVETDGRMGLAVDPLVVETFLATTFGGTPRALRDSPERILLISNGSDVPEAGDWYRKRLLALGVPPERVLIREISVTTAPTRLLTTAAGWAAADYYASLMHVAKQQIARLEGRPDAPVAFELVLGNDHVAR